MFLENWENWCEWSEDEGQVEKGQRKTNLAPLGRYRGGRRRAEEGLKPGVKLGRCLLGAQVPPCLRRLLHRRSRAAIMGRKGFARIVILAGFQDPMHQMQQFAHDGYHDAHARLATCLERGRLKSGLQRLTASALMESHLRTSALPFLEMEALRCTEVPDSCLAEHSPA